MQKLALKGSQDSQKQGHIPYKLKTEGGYISKKRAALAQEYTRGQMI
jgi:hypothetical protein